MHLEKSGSNRRTECFISPEMGRIEVFDVHTLKRNDLMYKEAMV
jgi:hypothetical protein